MARAIATALPAPPPARRIDDELALVRASVELIASGGARRATVIGLQFGLHILPEAQTLGRARGVLVRGLWNPAAPGPDIAVEPIS